MRNSIRPYHRVAWAIVCCWTACAAGEETPWRSWNLPSTRPAEADQPVWIRAYVRVPDAWAQPSGLLSQSVVLRLEQIADVCQVTVNGKSLGACGSLPPAYQSAREEAFRLKIPAGTLQPGAYNAIVLQLHGYDGRLGFLGRAPIVSGYHEECLLQGTWQYTTTAPSRAELMARTDRPALAAFDEVRRGMSALRRPQSFSPGRHLDPAQALAAIATADGLAVDLVLAEPQIAQPLSLDFDERGRLWVVQYRQYPFPAGIKMVSRDKYYRAVYDGVPQPPPNHVAGHDRISIHEDADGNGTLETHRVFVDGLNITSSIEIDHDGVWVLNPPYLLFYADRDHDDVPDGDPEVHLEGFGLEDTHSIANSLTFGPDGWLYGAQGSTTSSRIRVHGAHHREVYRDGAMIWRYHPPTRRYEIFAEGGGNAFGLDIDAAGNVFAGHNGGNTRGFHYVPGGYYQKGTGDKYGPLSNHHAYGHLMYMAHPPTPRFSHDLVRYQSPGLPARFGGQLLAIDPLQQAVIAADLIAEGSTFRTEDRETMMSTSDLAFRPVDITVGPDGAVYVADFCEEFIAHGQHYQGQVDTATGRVFRLRSGKVEDHLPLSEVRFDRADPMALMPYLDHPNRWHRKMARRLIPQSADAATVDQLMDSVTNTTGRVALESLWTLHQMGSLHDELARQLIEHPDAEVRRWTVRLLGERETISRRTLSKLVSRATCEPNPSARSQLASTARRLPVRPALAIVDGLSRFEDQHDAHLPGMLWWALERHADNHQQVQEWLAEPSVWQRPMFVHALCDRLMRRYASGSRRDLMACARLLELAPDDTSRASLLNGFEAAFEGRTLLDLPEPLADALSAAGGGSLSLRVRRGEPAAIVEATKRLHDQQTKLTKRVEYARLLGQTGGPQAQQTLLSLLQQDAHAVPTLFSATLASLQAFRDPQIATAVLAEMTHWTPELRADACRLLASRTEWSHALLTAIENQQVTVDTVPVDAVARLNLHADETLQQRTNVFWKPDNRVDPHRQAEQQRVQQILQRTGVDSDPYRGRELFMASCAKCHQLFRRGGQIGPNLTAYRRDDSQRMTMHIVSPSAEIREGFENWTAITTDGRIVTGLMVDQDGQVVTLRGVDGQNILLLRSEMDDLSRSANSLMPDGLLADFADQQIRDLFAYLRLSQPLNER